MKLDKRDIIDQPSYEPLQCQCAQCRASRALDVLRALPSLPDDGRAALDTIEAALNELEEGGFARWEAMNDVATAAGLNWMDATQQDIVDAIKQARARVAELESQLAAQQWRPGSETPAPDWYQTAETIDGAFSHAYFDGAVWQGYPDNYPPMWYRPIPPLPASAPQEPTL